MGRVPRRCANSPIVARGSGPNTTTGVSAGAKTSRAASSAPPFDSDTAKRHKAAAPAMAGFMLIPLGRF